MVGEPLGLGGYVQVVNMSQSAEKRARRAWRNRMQATAGSDWEKWTDTAKYQIKIVHRQKIVIIILSVLCVILSGLCAWGWF